MNGRSGGVNTCRARVFLHPASAFSLLAPLLSCLLSRTQLIGNTKHWLRGLSQAPTERVVAAYERLTQTIATNSRCEPHGKLL